MINENTDKSTKARIFEVAVELFYSKGYNFVSIREIAKAVGIKGSSIYNHYKSKEDILDAVFDYFKTVSASNYKDFDNEEDFEKLIETRNLEEVMRVPLNSSVGFLSNELIKRIFRIISIEQYHNNKVRDFFYENFVTGPRKDLERLFARLVEKGKVKAYKPETLAAEFHAYIIYKYYENVILRGEMDFDAKSLEAEFIPHIRFFCELIKA